MEEVRTQDRQSIFKNIRCWNDIKENITIMFEEKDTEISKIKLQMIEMKQKLE